MVNQLDLKVDDYQKDHKAADLSGHPLGKKGAYQVENTSRNESKQHRIDDSQVEFLIHDKVKHKLQIQENAHIIAQRF